MSILPTTNFNARNSSSSFGSPYGYGRSSGRVPLMLRRLFRHSQMDFQFALWQMTYLLIAPKRVYRNIYHHKQTKNQWARDDPAFLVVLAFFLCLSALGWGLVYKLGFMGILRTVLCMVFVDLLLVGSLVATFTWFVTNKFLTYHTMAHAVEQNVEWAYAFDVHCNSFFPLFLVLYVVQLFFLPLLQYNSWISTLFGNTLYCIAVVWYIYGTFLGFKALPFLVHTGLFLYPIGICLVLYLASLFGFNISKNVLALYFG